MGANGVSTMVPGAGNKTFSKVVRRPLEMLKQVFLARFGPIITRFSPCKFQNFLENGSFCDQKWVRKGSKVRFSKSDHG